MAIITNDAIDHDHHDHNHWRSTLIIWVCLKIVYLIVPNGFADHYPVFKWLFHWEY